MQKFAFLTSSQLIGRLLLQSGKNTLKITVPELKCDFFPACLLLIFLGEPGLSYLFIYLFMHKGIWSGCMGECEWSLSMLLNASMTPYISHPHGEGAEISAKPLHTRPITALLDLLFVLASKDDK